jgi:hypothetical protein
VLGVQKQGSITVTSAIAINRSRASSGQSRNLEGTWDCAYHHRRAFNTSPNLLHTVRTNQL